MKEKKKIPWGLIYVGLTVVVMIVFGLVNTEFAGMFSVIANLSLGFGGARRADDRRVPRNRGRHHPYAAARAG